MSAIEAMEPTEGFIRGIGESSTEEADSMLVFLSILSG